MSEDTRLLKMKKFCDETGYTIPAVQGKIRTRKWTEGVQYHKAPDGKILIDMGAFRRWAEGQQSPPEKKADPVTNSASSGKARHIGPA
jgi:hypothetical protein